MLHPCDQCLAAGACTDHASNSGNVCVDIRQAPGSEAQEPCPGSEDFAYRAFLVRNRRNHEIGLGRNDLLCIRSPRIGQDDTRRICNLGHDIGTVFCTGYHPAEFADRRKDHGGAGLQADNSPWDVLQGHSVILG